MRFCIDAGHNYSGVDTGAVGAKFKEQEFSFRIADRLRAILVNAGHQVKMTRETLTSNVSATTVAESLRERARISNEFGADYFISIHLNAGGGVGTETFVLARGGEAESIAEKVQSVFKELGRVDRGVKAQNLAVLRLTNAPAILVEVGFIDNAEEEVWISENIHSIARAIASAYGIEENEYYDLPINELTTVNDIVWELSNRGIISNKDLWLNKLETDEDSYWLARKCINHIRRFD